MLGDALLGGLAEVVSEVPPVRDLHGLRGPDGDALGEERGAVQHRDVRDRREQQLLQTEQNLIHSPELLAQPLLPLLVLRQLPEASQRAQSSLSVHGLDNLGQNHYS